jgi:hypothetical protein
MLSHWYAVAAGAAVLLCSASHLEAQTATQVVHFRVLPASRAAVEPVKSPLSMRGTTPAQGETRYAIGTTEPNRKLIASLDRAMPAGVSLSVALTPPSGAVASGPVVLDTVANDLLTSIPVAVESGLPVRYTLSAASPAAPLSTDERAVTVTYTVVEQP